MSDATAGTDSMSTQIDTGEAVDGSFKAVSLDRLVCLQRHWMWADEAMARFDRELGDGWDYDDDPMSDHPFGAYYHWCALLCAFAEAALDHGLLSPLELEPIRQDLETSFPRLAMARRCLGCGEFIWRSEKRSGRSTCRGRSTPWIRRAQGARRCTVRM